MIEILWLLLNSHTNQIRRREGWGWVEWGREGCTSVDFSFSNISGRLTLTIPFEAFTFCLRTQGKQPTEGSSWEWGGRRGWEGKLDDLINWIYYNSTYLCRILLEHLFQLLDSKFTDSARGLLLHFHMSNRFQFSWKFWETKVIIITLIALNSNEI